MEVMIQRNSTVSFIVWLAVLVSVLAVYFYQLQIHYPKIGHDHSYFISYLLAGRAHFLQQGLFPFRFTPYFSGGMVVFGNPQGMFYSPLQLLSLLLDPWLSIRLCIAASLGAGYIGWYKFGREVLILNSEWSNTLATVVITSGFFLMHMVAGHMTFLYFPLIGIFAWKTFRKSSSSHAHIIKDSIFISLLAGLILYSGGYVVLFFAAIVLSLIIPFAAILHPSNEYIRLLFTRVFWFFIGSLLLCISKIVAVFSFMQNVPRIRGLEDMGTFSTVSMYIVKSLWSFPQTPDLFMNLPWGMHEKSTFISPFALLGLLFLPYILLRFWREFSKRRFSLLILWSAFTLYVLHQFVQGHGLIVSRLWKIPPFYSMHVPTRFMYILSLFVIIASVYALGRVCSIQKKYSFPAAAFVSLCTVAVFFLAYSPTTIQKSSPVYNYDFVKKQLDSNYAPVTPKRYKDPANMMNGDAWLTRHEPLFDTSRNYGSRKMPTRRPSIIKNGVFNMRNPACYQYPAENNCSPGDYISNNDKENFINFLESKPVTWRISIVQKIADTVSLGTLCLLLLLFIISKYITSQNLAKLMLLRQ